MSLLKSFKTEVSLQNISAKSFLEVRTHCGRASRVAPNAPKAHEKTTMIVFATTVQKTTTLQPARAGPGPSCSIAAHAVCDAAPQNSSLATQTGLLGSTVHPASLSSQQRLPAFPWGIVTSGLCRSQCLVDPPPHSRAPKPTTFLLWRRISRLATGELVRLGSAIGSPRGPLSVGNTHRRNQCLSPLALGRLHIHHFLALVGHMQLQIGRASNRERRAPVGPVGDALAGVE